MMSSASYPSFSTTGIRNAAEDLLDEADLSLEVGRCLVALGLVLRVHLGPERAPRHVEGHHAWVGRSSRSTLKSIEVKPYTALVGWPVLVEKFSTGSAKNARYASECPSTSSSLGASVTPSDSSPGV
jgi:hypothetical protein